MDNAALSLVSASRFAPATVGRMSIPEAAVAWHRAGFDVHPAKADGSRISGPHRTGRQHEQDILRAFSRHVQLPGLQLGVNLPDDVAVIIARPLGQEDWRGAIQRLQAKFDPGGDVLFRCPCHRKSRQSGSYLWLTVPETSEEAHIWGPENTSVLLGETFVQVPPGGVASEGTKASWMGPPPSAQWEIPPCPPALWRAIQACAAQKFDAPTSDDRATDDQDCGM
jgi:hypothetical protein